MELPRELIELFSEFESARVQYLLDGGHAVAAHGRPRATKDVDLWVRSGAGNIARACRALLAFGLPSELVEQLRTASAQDIVWFGRSPTRVDILQTLPGVEFAEAWSRRLVLDFAGASVPVIGKADLIRNKQSVGRAQDLRDVRALTGRTPARPRLKTKKRR